MNNLVYFRENFGWFYDCDSFLGYWGITKFVFEDYSGWVYDYDSFLALFSVWLMIMIVSWAILSGFVIMIVSWAIEKVYF